MGTGGSTSHASYVIAPTAPSSGTPDTIAGTTSLPDPTPSDRTAPHPTGAEPIATPAPRPLADDQLPSESVVEATTDADDAAATDASAPDPADADPFDPNEILTPIPAAPQEGLVVGEPVLVDGADLVDSTATLMSYSDKAGPREVLLATVTPEAEAKLMEALALADTVLVAVHVEQEVDGRLARDEEGELHEKVSKAARSVNHKMKTGAPIPASTGGYYQAADAAIAAVENDPDATEIEQTMAAHYRVHLDLVHERMNAPSAHPYDAGGKIPLTTPFEHHGTAEVTNYVPAPVQEPPPGMLRARLRDASRIKPTLGDDGAVSWNGKTRRKATGAEYEIDLGDGYTAVYRPRADNTGTNHETSLRGQLEVHAPAGAGHGHDLVSRLGAVNLVNQPMTRAEGEWTYLTANVAAQGLDKNPAVKAALAQATQLEDIQTQELFYNHAHEAVGMDANQLHTLAQQLQLQSHAQVLPHKATLLRDAVASATGYGSGADLAASAGYDPTPQRSGGWLTWGRFDVKDSPTVAAAWKGKSLVHHVSGHNLQAILQTGVLASTERRALMGVGSGLGMSESADKFSGGANSVFLRVRSGTSTGSGGYLVWDDPSTLITRADYYAYNGDHFGAVPGGNKSTHGATTDPVKIAAHAASSNEVMFRHGIDLFGAEAPSRVVCSSLAERTTILAQLLKQGITQMGGRPIEAVITTC